jgi:ubiquinol-cytochrome c reductase cytochrome b subunit
MERVLTGDQARHDLLDRPRDRPWRTALGAAFFTWVATIFVAGAADRILVQLGVPYEAQVWFFRVAAFVGPVLVGTVTLRVCRELRAAALHPLREREHPPPAVRARRSA